MKTPRTDLQANTYDFENIPLVKATGFREYDARWWFGGPQYPKAPNSTSSASRRWALALVP